jgi:hypothetical protein
VLLYSVLMNMRQATRFLTLTLIVSGLATSLSSADDSNQSPAPPLLGAEFSADNFDWREMVPYLFMATSLPAEQGIKAVLENSRVLRTYVTNQVQTECRPGKSPCAANSDGATLDGEVSKRIAEIVQETILWRHKTAIVDYPLTRRPFPFSEIAALKSEKNSDVYLILALADRSYTAADVQAKYGDPYDTDIYQWYSIFKYRLDRPGYASRAVFEIDPVDGAVIKVAISLKLKKPKNHR